MASALLGLNLVKFMSKFMSRAVPLVTTNRCAADDMSQQSEKLVETETIGQVFLVGINRPEKRNCVNVATAQQLSDAFQRFEADDGLSVAVLYGKGGNFCAGYDLGELAGVDSVETIVNKMPIDVGGGGMGPTRRMIRKPVIAAISGYAVAGGLELACMCDLRVAEESAIFGVFCRRFGVPLLDGGAVRLPKLIGLSRALDLILTGRPVNANEALMMGLANRVVPTGSAVGEATKLAQTLCSFPQECMRRDRESAYNSVFNATSMADAFTFEFNNGKQVLSSESVQGANRFVQGVGRKGNFDINSKSKL
jgi:enoyl-CoA hydratase/carnithine racemase